MINKLRELKRVLVPKKKLWIGDYSSWAEVSSQCRGYASSSIADRVIESTRKVCSGEFKYERDSILFHEIERSWPLVTALVRCEYENSRLNVLDFGGSLGSSFRQCADLLDLNITRWSVVEQDSFVKAGQLEFQTEHLKFYSSIDECLSSQSVNFVLASSVLEYLENPSLFLKQFVSAKPKYIVLDRIPISDSNRNILTKQIVPRQIYDAEYPCWFFSREFVLSFFDSSEFDLIIDTPSFVPNEVELDGGVSSIARCLVFKSKN